MPSGIYKRTKSKKLSKEHKWKIMENAKVNPNYGMRGKKHTETTKQKLRKANLGKKLSEEHIRNDPEYKQWVRKVKLRDKQTRWINDENCKGYNIVHHIFPWRKYPKLRYKLKNGITLCQVHHKRVHKTRAKERLFEKLFSYLVNQK